MMMMMMMRMHAIEFQDRLGYIRKHQVGGDGMVYQMT